MGEVWLPNVDGVERDSSVIENCDNYGNIIGVIYVGGIVGEVSGHTFNLLLFLQSVTCQATPVIPPI